ncbi:AGE family epimerase/isomerase [Sphingobium sp. Sx8-8]|uniref:AGE family epimerase/isomerase n=1 Tax=Sphingobium sp. Sx8-8 TaxID=2933617 RepID=UPI001F5A721D|nr:AGE family epimerase/isomerase [Sphingobium sp. Sx8-8]
MALQFSPKHWLLDLAAPRWLEFGIDRENGGFFETIDARTLETSGAVKRLRTVSRQIFVFCELHRLGATGAHEAINHGLDFLLNQHAREDGAFHERVTCKGEPLEGSISLYDSAFALFALAKAYSLNSEPRLRDTAITLLAFLNQQLRHPEWGFIERFPNVGDREQNPHMHLLEAALAWLDNDADGPFRALAISLLETLECHLFCPELGILSEFPENKDGSLAQVHRFEPGHHFEWIWLLDWAATHHLPVPKISRALEKHALTDGLSAQTQVPYGAVSIPGGVIEQECRIWQVTEWTRAAALGLLENSLDDDFRSAQLMGRFLDFPVSGFWYERCRCADGKMIEEPVKATSFYHVIGAISALIKRPESATTMMHITAFSHQQHVDASQGEGSW